MESIRLGIIGCGVISASHIKLAAESPNVEVVAVADLIEDRARSAADEYGISSCYYNDVELLKDERVDAVVLAMPAGARTPVAYKALESGKHVLIEKPIGRNAEEVEKMIALQGDRVVACCSSRKTFTGHADAAAKCVASGSLGKIRAVRIRAVHGVPAEPRDAPPPWRQSMEHNGGGILVNWSCYDLDYMMYILGWQVKPNTLLANWWPVAEGMSEYVAPGSDADSHYSAFIRCDDDIVLTMERAEFSSVATHQAWEIIGTKASLHMTMQPRAGESHTVVLDTFVAGKGIESETIWDGENDDLKGNVLSDFVRAIGDGVQPRTGLERALIVQKITDAIYTSAKSGTSVSAS